MLIFSVFFLFCAAQASAQVRLGPAEADALVVEKPEPFYPPIAKAAKAHGVVKVEAVVSEDGRVISAKVVSGHPLLQSAAVSAVRRRKYKPHVVDGKPVSFVTSVNVAFSLDAPTAVSKHDGGKPDPQDELARQYFKEIEKCRALFKAGDWKAAEPPCKSAVGVAEKLSDGRELEKMSAYKMYGHVLVTLERPREALEYYARAHDAVRSRLDETDAELSELYGNIAVAHHVLRDLDRAREFYRKSERSFQLAHEHIGRDDPDSDSTKEFRRQYTQSLKKIIGYHIIAAEQAGAAEEVKELKKLLEGLP